MRSQVRALLVLVALTAVVAGACQQATTPSPSPSAAGAGAAAATPVPTPPMPVAAGHVRAVSSADKVVLSNNAVEITLHGGYGYHGNNYAITSGLTNVPVGSPVFLEGLAADPDGVKVTSWRWTIDAPAFSSAKIDVPNAQRPSFVADRSGEYTVHVTATNEKGKVYKSDITVNAGVYAGEAACATCHNGSVMPDMVSSWEQTNHARHLDLAFASYSAASDYCIQCHTTGYNESDTARGFDDRALASGWDKSKTSLVAFMSENKMTLPQLMAAPMGQLANIQCEACHGPGGSSHTAVKSFDVGVCAQCHSAQPAQWAISGHKNTGAATQHMAGNTGCVQCHTGEGFVQVTVRGKEPVFPSMATASEPANLSLPTLIAGVTCAACHDPHAATNPGEPRAGHSDQLRLTGEVKMPNGTTVDAGFSGACVSCHANERTTQYMQQFVDGTQQRGAHRDTQADVLYGVGAYTYGEQLRTSAHQNASEACITCHMAPSPVMDNGPDGKAGTRDDVAATMVGGHSCAMSGAYTGLKNGVQVSKLLVENVAGCNTKGCHSGDPLTSFDVKAPGDYDGDGAIESLRAEVDGLMKLLADKLPKDDKGVILSSGISDKNSTRDQRMALWNYQLVLNDGSRGIHDPEFTIQLLQTTYKHLTGGDVPNAKVLR